MRFAIYSFFIGVIFGYITYKYLPMYLCISVWGLYLANAMISIKAGQSK